MKAISQLSLIPLIAVALAANSCNPTGSVRSTEKSTPPAATGSNTIFPYQISARGIGPIRLGMTLDEARKALPHAEFERTSDGEGIALIALRIGGESIMVLYAGEGDPESPINWSRSIEQIETFSSKCVTADGVRKGTLIADAERVYGKTKSILRSEIEAREHITFEDHPEELLFRIDYTGDFPAGSRTTTKYKPGAKIFSIKVHSW